MLSMRIRTARQSASISQRGLADAAHAGMSDEMLLIWQSDLGAAMRRVMDFVPIPLLLSACPEDAEEQQVRRRHLYVNQAFLDQIGYTIEDIPYMEDWFELAYPDPDYRAKKWREWQDAVRDAILEGKNSASVEKLVRCKDGQQRWFIATGELKNLVLPGFNMIAFRNVHDLKSSLNESDILARTDGLTGLLNRRAIENELDRHWHRYKTERRNFTVLLCDVDRFKRINDTHGHDAGDEVLRQLAIYFGRFIRCEDRVGRWGGEEFLLILANSFGDKANGVIARLHDGLEKISESIFEGEHVTLSIGCSDTAMGSVKISELVKQADRALYKAKHLGGAQTRWFSTED